MTNNNQPQNAVDTGLSFQALWDARYHALIPILPPDATILTGDAQRRDRIETNRGKIPGRYDKARGGWTGYERWSSVTPDSETITRWSRWPGAGCGILCGQRGRRSAWSFGALDLDISAPGLVDALLAMLKAEFGFSAVRTGRAPRVLLPFTLEKGFDLTKQRYALTGDDAADGDAVEILGRGQQFVAFGIHPKTRRAYQWDGFQPAWELPRFDRTRLEAVLSAVERVCEDYGTGP